MNIKVLIIEDQILIAENLKDTLIDLGYIVSDVCYSYKAALNAFEKNNFDIVIIDINLGEDATKGGLQLAEILLSKVNCPIIFLTAYSDKYSIQNAAKYSPAAYLVKPVNEKTLFSTIQLAIHNFQLSKRNIALQDYIAETPFFFARSNMGNVKIFWKNVSIIKSVKNNIELIDATNHETYKIRTSIAKLLETLIPEEILYLFLRINRSTLINKNFITSYTKEKVYTVFGSFEITNDYELKKLQLLKL